jgi:hypothetical protein
MVYLRVPTVVFYIIQASARWCSPRDRGSNHSPAQEGKRVGGYEQSERVGRLGEEKDLCKRDLAAAGSVSQTTLGRAGRDQGIYLCSGGALGKALGVESSPSLGRVPGRLWLADRVGLILRGAPTHD